MCHFAASRTLPPARSCSRHMAYLVRAASRSVSPSQQVMALRGRRGVAILSSEVLYSTCAAAFMPRNPGFTVVSARALRARGAQWFRRKTDSRFPQWAGAGPLTDQPTGSGNALLWNRSDPPARRGQLHRKIDVYARQALTHYPRRVARAPPHLRATASCARRRCEMLRSVVGVWTTAGCGLFARLLILRLRSTSRGHAKIYAFVPRCLRH